MPPGSRGYCVCEKPRRAEGELREIAAGEKASHGKSQSSNERNEHRNQGEPDHEHECAYNKFIEMRLAERIKDHNGTASLNFSSRASLSR